MKWNCKGSFKRKMTRNFNGCQKNKMMSKSKKIAFKCKKGVRKRTNFFSQKKMARTLRKKMRRALDAVGGYRIKQQWRHASITRTAVTLSYGKPHSHQIIKDPSLCKTLTHQSLFLPPHPTQLWRMFRWRTATISVKNMIGVRKPGEYFMCNGHRPTKLTCSRNTVCKNMNLIAEIDSPFLPNHHGRQSLVSGASARLPGNSWTFSPSRENH